MRTLTKILPIFPALIVIWMWAVIGVLAAPTEEARADLLLGIIVPLVLCTIWHCVPYYFVFQFLRAVQSGNELIISKNAISYWQWKRDASEQGVQIDVYKLDSDVEFLKTPEGMRKYMKLTGGLDWRAPDWRIGYDYIYDPDITWRNVIRDGGLRFYVGKKGFELVFGKSIKSREYLWGWELIDIKGIDSIDLRSLSQI